MYLIKDVYGNYFDAEKAHSFEVQFDGLRFELVAVIISGDKFRYEYSVSRHETKEEAREHLDALINTINGRMLRLGR